MLLCVLGDGHLGCILLFLFEEENRKILVDVGCDVGAGFEMSIFEKPVLVLEKYGLKAPDITDVVITHAHHDHIAAIQPYKNAVIHIQEIDGLLKVKKVKIIGYWVTMVKSFWNVKKTILFS